MGFWIGVYRRLYRTDPTTIFTSTFKQALLGTLGFLAVQHLIDPHLDVSRLFVALFCTYAFVLLLLYRFIFGQIRERIRKQMGARVHYVIVGAGPAGVIAAETLRRMDTGASIQLVGDQPQPPRVVVEASFHLNFHYYYSETCWNWNWIVPRSQNGILHESSQFHPCPKIDW